MTDTTNFETKEKNMTNIANYTESKNKYMRIIL
jgi:hypothetical protein